MDKHDITRMLIESTVGRTLKQMQRDLRRSIRSLVDMGVTFSTGRFQKPFLELTQTMLENQQSAYYTLLDTLVRQVDHETLKTFGVNLGYEGLTCGAATIRRIEDIGSYNVPWMLTVECGGAIDLRTLRDIVRQGVEQGVFTYGLIAPHAALTEVQELTEAYPKCAFLLLTTGENLLRQGLETLEDCHNLFVAVKVDERGLEASEALAAGGFFYGISVWYTDETCLSPEALEGYLDYHPAAVLLLPEREEAVALSGKIWQEAKALRLEQKYPYVLLEAVRDSLYVDEVISGDGCILYIRSDGEALGVEKSGVRPAGNILDMPLVRLLRQAVPKTPRPRREEADHG